MASGVTQRVRNRFKRLLSGNPLRVVLLVGLLNSLVFTFLVPPWQHYDEPSHFEFAWRLANHPKFARADNSSVTMRREILTSMVEHGFFDGMSVRPRQAAAQEPVWIGVSQQSEFPLYYLWVSLPLHLVSRQEIDIQLHAARLWSALLYLFVLFCAYRAARLVSPGEPLFHWMLPISLALWPSFTDIMTAVNDDVGAVSLTSGALWLSAELIAGRLRWRWAPLMAALGGAAVMVKSNTVFILPVMAAALGFAALRNRQKLALILAASCLGAILLASLAWGDAAYWLRLTDQAQATRQMTAAAPSGSHAIALHIEPGKEGEQLRQKIPLKRITPSNRASYTLGAWMWADRPTKAASPALVVNEETVVKGVTLSEEPAFFVVTSDIEQPVESLWVKLKPFSRLGSPATIYYDGLILVEGKFSADVLPWFDEPDAGSGLWGTERFTNLIRNPSAEQAWPRLRPWVDRITRGEYPGHMSLILQSLLDPETSGWYYRAALRSLIETFWGKFGWGHVPLHASRPYRWLSLAAIAGALGAFLWAWRNRWTADWRLVFIMALLLAGVWGMVLLRGIDSIVGEVFIPSARYAFPAIIPTMLIIIGGWLYILCWLCKPLGLSKSLPASLILAFCLGLDLLGVWSIYLYYFR